MLYITIMEDVERFGGFLRGDVWQCLLLLLAAFGRLEVSLEAKGLLEAEIDLAVTFEAGEC